MLSGAGKPVTELWLSLLACEAGLSPASAIAMSPVGGSAAVPFVG